MSLIGFSTPAPTPSSAASAWVKDGTAQTFMQDVIQASMKVPVLVDFWAPWCGPCKQLTPILEKCVNEAKGKVLLVKINIDEQQTLAQQLRIQSVPTVYLFQHGQPVDGFTGAQPESVIRRLIATLSGQGEEVDPLEDPVALAKQWIEDGMIAEAKEVLVALVAEGPQDAAPYAMLARLYLSEGNVAGATGVLAAVPAELRANPEIAGAQAAADLAQKAPATPFETLTATVTAQPDNHAARMELADALFSRGQSEAAIDALLTIIGKDRAWNDDAARKHLLSYFEALGHAHPHTVAGRRKLSALLFS